MTHSCEESNSYFGSLRHLCLPSIGQVLPLHTFFVAADVERKPHHTLQCVLFKRACTSHMLKDTLSKESQILAPPLSCLAAVASTTNDI